MGIREGRGDGTGSGHEGEKGQQEIDEGGRESRRSQQTARVSLPTPHLTIYTRILADTQPALRYIQAEEVCVCL